VYTVDPANRLNNNIVLLEKNCTSKYGTIHGRWWV